MLSKTEAVFNVRGVMPAVFTALNEDYTVNYKGIHTYVKYLADNGIKAALVGGTTGQHMCLNINDRKRIIDAWVDAAKATNLHVQVQVGGAAFPDVIELKDAEPRCKYLSRIGFESVPTGNALINYLTKYCASKGVNSILTLPELYFRPQSVEELVSYVEMVADAASGLPVLYYHNPLRSNVTVSMPAFFALASERIPTFKGLKFASVDLVEANQIVKIVREDQELFLGGERLIAPAALLGIKSCMTTSGNLFPRMHQEILQAVENNDVEKARDLQKKLTSSVDSITAEGEWVTTLKAAMEILTGMRLGPPSLPNKPLSAEAWRNIENKLKNISC